MPIKERKNPRLIERNEDIRNKFDYYTDKKHFNTDHTLNLLESEFKPLLASTIWLIVSKTGHYKNL